MTSDELLKYLKQDLEDTKDYLKSKEEKTLRHFLAHLLVKSTIALKYALPFLVASALSIYLNSKFLNNTFYIDKIKDIGYNQEIITSTGINIDKTSYDINYDDNSIRYTTGWNIDNNGLYYREETIYDLSNEEKYMDSDVIENITKEELDNILEVEDIKVIRKNQLNQEDYFYNEDMIIFTYSSYDDSNIRYRNETSKENRERYINIILLSVLFDGLIRLLLIKTIDSKINQKLEDLKIKYCFLSSDEYSELLDRIELKKKNIKILELNNKVKKIGEKHE